jgi:very-short-patch-repair endonuclease
MHTTLHGIPITSVRRTLLDIARHFSDRGLARSVREAVRLELITVAELGDALGAYRGRRGSGRLAATVARYAGLPLVRARSGAEVRALEVLREAGRLPPRLNVRIAGEEADLSWMSSRLIIEIDGEPFHRDRGEDARKQARWEAAGWTVRRISSDGVYDRPEALLALAPPSVPEPVV